MNVNSLRWLLIVVAKLLGFAHANWITGNLCWSMPCMNGGSCFGSAYTYLCVCPANYSGALCERRLGICQESPCGNRGLCVETSLTAFECRCYFDYMGPLCEEHVPKNDPSVWSSLIPVHTRVLFDILQHAYRAKAHSRSAFNSNDSPFDFMNLLPTNDISSSSSSSSSSATTPQTTVESTSHYLRSETTEDEHIIRAENIQLERIFPGISTASTSDTYTENLTIQTTAQDDSNNETIMSTYFEEHTTSSLDTLPTEDTTITILFSTTIDNITTASLEQNQTTAYNITEADEFLNITEQQLNITTSSTPVNWSSYNSDNYITTDATEIIENSTEQLNITTESEGFSMHTTSSPLFQTMLHTSSETNNYSSLQTDDNLFNTSEQIMTSTMNTIDQQSFTTGTVNNTHTTHSQLLYKLCQQLLSHILPNVSSSTAVEAALSLASESLPNGNHSDAALLSWIKEQFRSATTSTTTTTSTSISSLPSLLINGKKISLHRVDMDDVLYQMNNNNIDDEQ